MRIPFPTSIPLIQAFLFFGFLLGVQLIEGTDPVFAALMMAAQIFGIMAFNTLGGFSHVAGAFCLFSLLPNVTVPEITHAIVLQPGDFNIPGSLQTANACAIFYACLYVSAQFVVLLPTPRPFVDRVYFSLTELRAISIICIAFVLISQVVWAAAGGEVKDGSLLAALGHFYGASDPLSVVAATQVRLKSTQGKSAMSWYVALILAAATFPGIIGASKEGMLVPLFCWLIVCAVNRYRFTRTQVTVLAGIMLFVWFFVYPFAQGRRDLVRAQKSIPEKLAVVVASIRDPSEFLDQSGVEPDESSEYGAISGSLSIIPRFSLLRSNGMLIDADDTVGFTDIDRILPAFLVIVPHFLWPDRPDPISSNELGHKAGFDIARNDTTTGITIGSPSQFFDMGGWVALPVYTILVFGPYFYALRCMFGESRDSVWGLLMIGAIANMAGVLALGLIIQTLLQFIMIFFILVAALKVIAYVSETLFARPIAQ